jgi:predicted dehydrogenase
VQVAILGYGAIAREHALSLRRIGQEPFDGDISLSAVMGRLPAPTRAFADEFDAVLATTDLDELLAHRAARGADGARIAGRQARAVRDPAGHLAGGD